MCDSVCHDTFSFLVVLFVWLPLFPISAVISWSRVANTADNLVRSGCFSVNLQSSVTKLRNINKLMRKVTIENMSSIELDHRRQKSFVKCM